eukprot:c22602_g1_i1.p1 GENE.c22602_g1_i1~~c22602_g1_i1.p1  ORF type:complete len:158 (-),score=25.30 c22602_g1_i1:89-532(-)
MSDPAASAGGGRVVRLARKGGVVVQDCDVYIGRRLNMGGWRLSDSKWANPFAVKTAGSNEKACAKYEVYLRGNAELMAALPELAGKTLGCWCKPAACHGDVLLRVLAEVQASDGVAESNGESRRKRGVADVEGGEAEGSPTKRARSD